MNLTVWQKLYSIVWVVKCSFADGNHVMLQMLLRFFVLFYSVLFGQFVKQIKYKDKVHINYKYKVFT